VVDLNFNGFGGQHKFWDMVHSTAQITEPSPGICAVMGGAGVTEVKNDTTA